MAHSSEIAAKSTIAREKFHSESEAYNLDIIDISPESLQQFSCYLDTGSISLSNTIAIELLRVSKDLGMASLSESCIKYLDENVTDDNCLDIYSHSIKFNISDIIIRYQDKISLNFCQLQKDERLFKLPAIRLETILKSDHLEQKNDEFEVVEFISNRHAFLEKDSCDPDERSIIEADTHCLLSNCVRFEAISFSFLSVLLAFLNAITCTSDVTDENYRVSQLHPYVLSAIGNLAIRALVTKSKFTDAEAVAKFGREMETTYSLVKCNIQEDLAVENDKSYASKKLPNVSIRSGKKIIMAYSSDVVAKSKIAHDKFHSEAYSLNITDISTESLQQFSYYLDTGNITLSNTNAIELLRVSKDLEIASLSESCIKYLNKNITIDNCLDIFLLSIKFQISDIISQCQDKIPLNFCLLQKDDRLLKMPAIGLQSILKSDFLELIKDEFEVVEFISERHAVLEKNVCDPDELSIIETDTRNLLSKCVRFEAIPLSILSVLLGFVKSITCKSDLDGENPRVSQLHQYVISIIESNALRALVTKNKFTDAEAVAKFGRKKKTKQISLLMGGRRGRNNYDPISEIHPILCDSTGNVSCAKLRNKTKLNNLPQAMRGASAVVVNRKTEKNPSIEDEREIFLVGGINDQKQTLNSTWVYSVRNDEWRQIPKLNEERCYFGLVFDALMKRIYAIGGWNGGSKSLDSCEVLNLDESPLTWKRLSQRLNQARWNFSSIIKTTEENNLPKSTIFALGGYGSSLSCESFECSSSNAKWTILSAHLSNFHEGSSLFQHDGELFICDRGTMESLDSGSNEWKVEEAMSDFRLFAACTSIKNKFYLFGGDNVKPEDSFAICFDCESRKWITINCDEELRKKFASSYDWPRESAFVTLDLGIDEVDDL